MEPAAKRRRILESSGSHGLDSLLETGSNLEATSDDDTKYLRIQIENLTVEQLDTTRKERVGPSHYRHAHRHGHHLSSHSHQKAKLLPRLLPPQRDCGGSAHGLKQPSSDDIDGQEPVAQNGQLQAGRTPVVEPERPEAHLQLRQPSSSQNTASDAWHEMIIPEADELGAEAVKHRSDRLTHHHRSHALRPEHSEPTHTHNNEPNIAATLSILSPDLTLTPALSISLSIGLGQPSSSVQQPTPLIFSSIATSPPPFTVVASAQGISMPSAEPSTTTSAESSAIVSSSSVPLTSSSSQTTPTSISLTSSTSTISSSSTSTSSSLAVTSMAPPRSTTTLITTQSRTSSSTTTIPSPSTASRLPSTSSSSNSPTTASQFLSAGGSMGTASSSTSASSTTTASVASKDSDSGVPTATVVGSVVGGVAGLIIFLLLALLFLRWYKRHRRARQETALSAGGADISAPPTASTSVPSPTSTFLPSAAAPLMKRLSRPRSTPPPTGGTERSFQRISGRKLPSQFSPGIEGPTHYPSGSSAYPSGGTFTSAGTSVENPFADSRGLIMNTPASPTAAAAATVAASGGLRSPDEKEKPPVQSPPSREGRRPGELPSAADKEMMMPGPARTPVLHQGEAETRSSYLAAPARPENRARTPTPTRSPQRGGAGGPTGPFGGHPRTPTRNAPDSRHEDGSEKASISESPVPGSRGRTPVPSGENWPFPAPPAPAASGSPRRSTASVRSSSRFTEDLR